MPMVIPKRIYHYTSRATALEHILPTKKIRIGSLGLTNDPRETKEWGFQFLPIPVEANPALDFNLLTQIQQMANRIRRDEWWALCATLDDPDLVEPHINQPDLTHFKYGHARGRMWAQYADNHKGVCLVFDGPALHTAILSAVRDDPVYFGPVEYANEFEIQRLKKRLVALQLDYCRLRDYGVEAGVRAHIQSKFEDFFLEKSRDWEGEKEFRWLVNGQSGPYFVDIAMALRTVIAGVDFPIVYGPALWCLCGEINVRTEKMYWNNRIPGKQIWEPN